MIRRSPGTTSISFPKIKLCSQSMHSRRSLEARYPNIDFKILIQLYGIFHKIENMSAEEYAMAYLQDPRKILEIEENLQEPWTTLNKIDLDEFMANTRPEYILRTCKLNSYDCKHFWRFEKSLIGHCLAFDPNPLIASSNMRKVSLSLSVVQNESDITYGWNGYVTGYGIYYMHFADNVEDQLHEILVSESVTPIVTFQNVQRKFLNKPFTECKPSLATNNFSDMEHHFEHREHHEFYSQGIVIKQLFTELTSLIRLSLRAPLFRLKLDICSVCGCFPNYIAIAREMKPLNCTKKCTFFRHATCASRMINNREWITDCLPACDSFSFSQESIQYAQLNTKISQAIKRNDPDMSMNSIVINLAEETNVLEEEQATYTTPQFISDVGGSAGLVLGINMLSILTFGQRIIEFFIKGGFNSKRGDGDSPEKIFGVGTDKRPSHVTDELLLISEQRRIRANQLKWKKQAEMMEEARKNFRDRLLAEDEEEYRIPKLIFAPQNIGERQIDERIVLTRRDEEITIEPKPRRSPFSMNL
ncbi:Oidioi.mRNA.OKI2018_I69.chr2.g4528.t1.cds [Oikopleura dioica]|uniref:Oidioi.mRNA.OKI2018_I69.chr2.g4528.t1.cds n=1 Tax=Oikopleura dioica TaxID=34765 RepID=A0ABN7SXQ2_OIKDI|nr:Oidioi.mRNA.OKI2018_I69.chr2.g4528.t1.cds [Oikopleura dioica]